MNLEGEKIRELPSDILGEARNRQKTDGKSAAAQGQVLGNDQENAGSSGSRAGPRA